VFGIVGAALASLISKFIFNFIKFLFLYKKFRFQPFDYKFVLLIIISFTAYAISLSIPQLSSYILDIIVRSTVISVAFLLPVYFLKISDDVNLKINETISLVLKIIKSK
jgi:hypothetical protein